MDARSYNIDDRSSQNQAEKRGNVSRRANVKLDQKTILQRVYIGVGLLCLLQVALNITLRLHSINKCQMWNSSLDEERDLLLTKFSILVQERDRLYGELDDLGGWKSFQSSLYFFSIERKTWYEARKDCRQRGADLVIINSKEEQHFISEYTPATWIGLSDIETEGEWKWVDGTPLNNGLWIKNEPNNEPGSANGEDCVVAFGREWNDDNCNLNVRWTCQKREIMT